MFMFPDIKNLKNSYKNHIENWYKKTQNNKAYGKLLLTKETYSRVSNKRTGTFIFFESKFPPVRTLLGPVRLFILKFFSRLYVYSLLYVYLFWPDTSPTFFFSAFIQCIYSFIQKIQCIYIWSNLPCTFILACTFIYFSSNFPPVRLFWPVRLLISVWFSPLYVYSLLYVY